MIQQKTVFETEDGKQFSSLYEAEKWQLRCTLEKGISDHASGYDFSVGESVEWLLNNYTLTPKPPVPK